MADIFISYGSKDRGTAKALAASFETSGWSVWWDESLRARDEFAKVIQRELDGSGCVVVLWSQDAAESGWVTAESQLAFNANKDVPVRLDNHPLPFFLSPTQAPSLVGWDGTAASPLLNELHAAVLDRLDRSRLIDTAPCALFRCAAIAEWGCASGGRDGVVRVWDLDTGMVVHDFTGHGDLATAVAYNGEGLLVSGSTDRTARIWSLVDDTLVHSLVGHGGPVDDVAFSEDTVVTVSADQTIRWWSSDTAEPLHSHATSCALLSCDAVAEGRTAVAGRVDGGIIVFANGKEVRSIERAHDGPVYSMSLADDGSRILSTGADAVARLWETKSGSLVRTFQGHRGPVLSGAFGRGCVITGSTDGTVRVWDADHGLQIDRFAGLSGGVPGVDSTAGGTVVATSAGGQIRAVDLTGPVSPD